MSVDPISVLTSIPDLIERCIKGYDFLKDVKDAPNACSELMKELDNTRAMLVELQEHVSGVEDREKVRLSASLQNYKTALDKLDAVLKKYRDPEFKFTFKTRFKWAWSGEKEIKVLCDDLKQNSGNFQPLLLQMVKDLNDMNKRQQEADAEKAADILAKRLRVQNVVNWLEPLNSRAKLREVRERRQLGTCEWLLSHPRFASWYSSGSFLWMNGIPGNGKTLLTSFVIDHLKKRVMTRSDETVLFAFADFQDARSTDVVVLLRTLLVQLLDHCKPKDFIEDPDFAELEKTMQRHSTDRPRVIQHLVGLLGGKASAPWKRVFIVIDALDECAQGNRRESIAAIRNLASAGSKFSVFVTSRREQDIVDVLSRVPTISLVNETQKVKDDIRGFIEVKMNKSYLSLARLPEPVRARISSTLLEKANGMFRLVDCQLQSLAEAKFEKEINEILQNLPADLNSMYERILQNVKEQGQEAVKRTLWWLVGSHRQLRLAELMEAIMVETGRDSPNTDLKLLAGENLLEMCSSLVRHDAETDILTLSHASVQDFLFSDYLKGTAHHHNYHIPSISFLHRHTTGLISAYLQYGDFQNGPCTTPQNLAKRLEQHPLFAYVASNWHRHIVTMYETCFESGEQPPDIHTFSELSDDPGKSILARRSCRQVFYFGTELRYITKDGSSKLQWKEAWGEVVHEDLLNVTESKYKSLKDVGGFVLPYDWAGPSWLVNEAGLLWIYPRRDLSNTTSVEELDYMLYPLLLQGPASLIRDLLHKLPQFKEHVLFYFGTPLMISIFAGKLDTIKMLVQDLHVDVNTCARHYDCDHEVVSPIFLATKYGHVEAVEFLLQHGSATVFPPEPRPKWSPEREPEDGLSDIIIGAADYGRADILQILIDHGVDKNTRSSISDNTVLHVAVRYGRIDCVKVLVEAGCDISPCSKGLKTPLDLALNQWSSDLVRYLLNKGASFNQCLPQNFEDLWWAVGEPWYPEMRQYLVTPRGGGPKSQQDIEKIVYLLGKRLSSPPPHIIRAILDFAELWIVTSAERYESTKIKNYFPCEPYISTPPIAGGPENLVRRIVFTTLSAEEELAFKGHTGGLYSDSSTWFEAGVESSPGGVFMRIQDNVSTDKQSRTHVNVWDYQDAPPSIKQWMSKIKAGDKISVYPRARYIWDNIVKSVKITVYTSCV
ncbi:uncharacterized protein ARMOST_06270 [Armillaria ostoyae]|uniref:Nephrocystin 3-like N-terminal domain-containing protein n=1 Tax=Armillaria ostoyae TaxID=47428 RepID=A0A284R2H5_ARMOS|nr:uncharacterized protein ARMOST_06270 [Armillaria ostoyae]